MRLTLLAAAAAAVVLLCTASTADASAQPLSKRGVCVAGDTHADAQKCSDLATVGVSWYYNWARQPSCAAGVAGVEYVPMIWGGNDVSGIPNLAPSDWLLGFNEPNYHGQADLSPAAAAALWPQLEATGRRLVGPAVADCGEGLGGQCTYSALGWYRDFLGNCTLNPSGGCRLNAVALHLYYCSAQDQMNKLTALFQLVQRPIWLTEFACDAPKNEAQTTSFAQDLLPRLESAGIVQRYAWFINYCDGCHTGDLLWDQLLSAQGGLGSSALTPLGNFYQQFASNSMQTLASSTPTSMTTAVYIDSGAEQTSWDRTGIHWLGDDLFATAKVNTAGATSTVASKTSVQDPSSGTTSVLSYILQTHRTGPVVYTIPSAVDANYKVTLLFSDPTSTAAGQRVFTVTIQGQVVETGLDIFSRTGGKDRALYLTYNVAATSSSTPKARAITVALAAVTGLPIIAGVIAVPATSYTPPTSAASVFVNVGGTSVQTDARSNTWILSNNFTSGGTLSGAKADDKITNMAYPDLEFVYKSYIFGSSTIRVPAAAEGTWSVTLMFAESFWSAAGKRVFALYVQNQLISSSFDIFARAGGVLKAYNLTLPVVVTPSLPFIVVQLQDIGTDYGLICGVLATPPSVSAAYVPPTSSTGTTGGGSTGGGGSTAASSTSTSSTAASSNQPSSTAPSTAASSTAASSTATTSSSSTSSDSSSSSTSSSGIAVGSSSSSSTGDPGQTQNNVNSASVSFPFTFSASLVTLFAVLLSMRN